MGYTTTFTGSLQFAAEPTAKQLAKLKTMLGIDTRELPNPPPKLDYIDFELCDDFSGIKWNGAEKPYHTVEQVNWLLDEMQKEWPDFRFVGCMAAQGEDCDDRWKLTIIDGRAVRVPDPPVGRKIECPECGRHFILDEAGE